MRVTPSRLVVVLVAVAGLATVAVRIPTAPTSAAALPPTAVPTSAARSTAATPAPAGRTSAATTAPAATHASPKPMAAGTTSAATPTTPRSSAPAVARPAAVAARSSSTNRPVAVTPAAVTPAAVTATPALGVVGPYTGAQLTTMTQDHVSYVLVELSWAAAEPTDGGFATAYLTGIAAQIRQLRSRGFRIALNTGMDQAPAWFLAQPGARFVDQLGDTYAGTEPNLIFGTQYRPQWQRYLTTVLHTIGAVDLVRTGGGHWGELTYPSTTGANGLVQNRYWAFDVDARRLDPVPGWVPGSASPHGQASAFLTWYLNSLAGFQNWQLAALRAAGYSGPAAVLYPSYGMRPGDFAAAVGDNLGGRSAAEINGEVQRGLDPQRDVDALTDAKAVVYGTWADNPATIDYLSTLARARHLTVMGENSGGNTQAQLDGVIQTAVRDRLGAVFLVRAPELFTPGSRDGTLAGAVGTLHALAARS